MSVLKELTADVEHVLLAVIFDEVTMTSNDFMEEWEVFDLLKKKKLQCGICGKIMDSPSQFSHIQHDTAERPF